MITVAHSRKGIVRYNHANAAKIVHGYNETITVFFVEMIARALAADSEAGMYLVRLALRSLPFQRPNTQETVLCGPT